MKLNSAQVERTLKQFEAQALPDDHPVVPQLASMFGCLLYTSPSPRDS